MYYSDPNQMGLAAAYFGGGMPGSYGMGGYGGGWSSPSVSGWGQPYPPMSYAPSMSNSMSMMNNYWTPERMLAAQGMGGYAPTSQQQTTGGAPEPARLSGAQRPGMGYRAQRRQSKQAPMSGGYQPSNAAAASGWANDPNGTPGSDAMAGFFNSPFGQLTTASGGNSNMFKRLGGSEQDGMFFYTPSGWQQTSLNDYRAGAGANAVDPNQAQYRDQAGVRRQQFQRTNVPPHLRGY